MSSINFLNLIHNGTITKDNLAEYDSECIKLLAEQLIEFYQKSENKVTIMDNIRLQQEVRESTERSIWFEYHAHTLGPCEKNPDGTIRYPSMQEVVDRDIELQAQVDELHYENEALANRVKVLEDKLYDYERRNDSNGEEDDWF